MKKIILTLLITVAVSGCLHAPEESKYKPISTTNAVAGDHLTSRGAGNVGTLKAFSINLFGRIF